jgi:hypothetical protein
MAMACGFLHILNERARLPFEREPGIAVNGDELAERCVAYSFHI